jgi:hypothetical protein
MTQVYIYRLQRVNTDRCYEVGDADGRPVSGFSGRQE